jgi:hypothetical protein
MENFRLRGQIRQLAPEHSQRSFLLSSLQVLQILLLSDQKLGSVHIARLIDSFRLSGGNTAG